MIVSNCHWVSICKPIEKYTVTNIYTNLIEDIFVWMLNEASNNPQPLPSIRQKKNFEIKVFKGSGEARTRDLLRVKQT